MSEPLQSQRLRIQAKLVEIAEAGDFFAVRYEGNKPVPIIPAEAATVSPKTAYANETGVSRFALDPKQGRFRTLKRSGWPFDLNLTFSQEVLLDPFLQSLLRPPVLPAEDGLRPVELILETIQVTHPQQGQPQTGTTAILHFTAIEGRE